MSYAAQTPTPRLESVKRCPRCASLLWPPGSPCPRCAPVRTPASTRLRVTQPVAKRQGAVRGASAPCDERLLAWLRILVVSIVCPLLLLAFFHLLYRFSVVSRFDKEVSQGNLTAVQALCLHDPCLINAHGYQGRTPLYWAALSGQQGVMHWLISQQADVNLADQHGCTPLFVAATCGQVGPIEQLLQAGANPWVRDSLGWTPLHAAAAGGHIEAVHCLTDESPLTLDERDYQGHTPLHVAVLADQVAVVDHILQTGGNANAKTNVGDTPLHLAKIRGSDSDLISLLISRGGTD